MISGISELECLLTGKTKVWYKKEAPNTSNTGISLKWACIVIGVLMGFFLCF